MFRFGAGGGGGVCLVLWVCWLVISGFGLVVGDFVVCAQC